MHEKEQIAELKKENIELKKEINLFIDKIYDISADLAVVYTQKDCLHIFKLVLDTGILKYHRCSKCHYRYVYQYNNLNIKQKINSDWLLSKTNNIYSNI